MKEITTAAGGRLMVFTRIMQDRVNDDGLPIHVVTFELTAPIHPEMKWRASLIGWVAAEEWSNSAFVRRRAARSLVGLGLRTANAIAEQQLRPATKPLPPPSSAVDVAYMAQINPDNLLRIALVESRLEVSAEGQIFPSVASAASGVLRRLAQELHGSIGLPANIDIFGK